MVHVFFVPYILVIEINYGDALVVNLWCMGVSCGAWVWYGWRWKKLGKMWAGGGCRCIWRCGKRL